MPTLSTFFGIVIRMYWDDHARPHFHVIYAEQEASYQVSPLVMTSGRLSKRINRLVRKWAKLHREELLVNWDLLSKHQEAIPIEGLE